MKLEIISEAERELENAAEWYHQHRVGLDASFLIEIRLALARIRAFPNAWTRVSRRCRRCRLNRFPYGIIYQIRDDTILVIAIAHLNRRPDFWRARERK